jgi:hypothetical protein
VPETERGLPGNHLSAGAADSEGACTVRTIFHQKHDIPHAHADEECVALFGGSRLFPEGEAFPVAAPGGLLSC